MVSPRVSAPHAAAMLVLCVSGPPRPHDAARRHTAAKWRVQAGRQRRLPMKRDSFSRRLPSDVGLSSIQRPSGLAHAYAWSTRCRGFNTVSWATRGRRR